VKSINFAQWADRNYPRTFVHRGCIVAAVSDLFTFVDDKTEDVKLTNNTMRLNG